MERDKIESILIDYIDGNITEQDKMFIEAELERNPEVKKLYDQLRKVMLKMSDASELLPGEALKSSFEQFLSQEIEKKDTGARAVMMIPVFYRIAAGIILLMVVGVTAYWIRKDIRNQERMAVMEKELENHKKVMMALIDNQHSASQRMQGVSVAYEMKKPDDEIVSTLVRILNNDPNTNVRLTALDALSKFNSDREVRKALIASLSIQKDPVVQIALIQLMVRLKEKAVVEQLEKITKDNRTMRAVKDEAYSGIFKLS